MDLKSPKESDNNVKNNVFVCANESLNVKEKNSSISSVLAPTIPQQQPIISSTTLGSIKKTAELVQQIESIVTSTTNDNVIRSEPSSLSSSSSSSLSNRKGSTTIPIPEPTVIINSVPSLKNLTEDCLETQQKLYLNNNNNNSNKSNFNYYTHSTTSTTKTTTKTKNTTIPSLLSSSSPKMHLKPNVHPKIFLQQSKSLAIDCPSTSNCISNNSNDVSSSGSNNNGRPIYPNCPFSPYASPTNSPRSNRKRQPLKESRRVSIEKNGLYIQLNQYKLMDSIGQVSNYYIIKVYFKYV